MGIRSFDDSKNSRVKSSLWTPCRLSRVLLQILLPPKSRATTFGAEASRLVCPGCLSS